MKKFDFYINGKNNQTNLLKTIKQAFKVTQSFVNSTVNIYLNPDVEHFILIDDIYSAQIPWQLNIDADFSLNIM